MNAQHATPNVVIVGRPNVGKSALFNRLIGRKIAIVHDQPGITRDHITAICARGTRPFQLSDMGGESELVLFVVDAKDGLTPVDEELARVLRKSAKPTVLIANKIDNQRDELLAADFDSLGFEKSLSVSAEHDRGIGELVETIDRLLPSYLEIQHPASSVEYPVAIAIIGRPNVGKSSFVNALVESERAIVSELPGTTRDAVDVSYERDGKQFLFIDTAGIRRRGKHSSSVEVFSVMRAERSIRRADLCVLIVDLITDVTAQDKRIAGLIQEASKARNAQKPVTSQ